MAFHDVRFPARLSFGSSGGPERLTEVVTLASGHEERNSPWSQSRRRYDAGLGVRSLDDVAEMIAFFEARAARLHGFRWKDWTDFQSCAPSGTPEPTDQVIGTGDGVRRRFALVKGYASGGVRHLRTIEKPLVDSVMVAIDGTVLGAGWTVAVADGTVTFDVAPADGATVTAGYAFDVPVRFDTDAVVVSAAGFAAGEIPSVPVVEIRL